MAADPQPDNVAALLDAVAKGDNAAVAPLFSLVYDELHRIASSYMRQERSDHTLQATALVHEAFLRLVGQGRANAEYANRDHFVATAAVAMRRMLVNHAKAKDAAKRGAGRHPVELSDAMAVFQDRAIDLLALDEALNRLAQHNPTQARLVELRFFGGMGFETCAEMLGISARSVYYEWAHARAWLRDQLAKG
jgi:RNA polymerase sigma factor (TIGR02999 family)